MTVTMKEHIASGAMPLVAVQLTVVVPFWNVLPEAGLQVTVTVGQPVAVGGLYVTTAEHWFGSVLVVMLDGQALRVGGWLMVIEAVCVPLSSVADTVAVPHEVAVNVLDAIKLASGTVVGETVPSVPAKVIVKPFSTVGLITAPLVL